MALHGQISVADTEDIDVSPPKIVDGSVGFLRQ
jgi:hypothetical protein